MPIFTTLGAACAKAWGFTSGLITDQYFNLVSLLLPGNGTNGAQNNTFLDGSSNNFTITRNGNTTQGTFSPFSQTGWGNYFSGSSYLIGPTSNAAMDLGTGAYTLEGWVYLTAYAGALYQSVIFCAGNATGAIAIGILPSGALELSKYGTGTIIASSANDVLLNTWYHVAVVRTSTATNDTKLYVNGVLKATGTDNNNWNINTTPTVGALTIANYNVSGYLSNVRVVKGVAVYTGAFTPPILPLAATQSAGTNIAAITGTQTSLLTCQSNRFRDASNNSLTITTSGSPQVTPFSPFAPTQSYSAAAVGGSGYFDGTGDYISTTGGSAIAVGAGAFTLEGWVYFNGFSDGAGFGSCAVSGDASTDRGVSLLINSASTWRFRIGRSVAGQFEDFLGSTTLTTGQWYHFQLVRTSTGTNDTRMYLNGVLQGSAGTSTININMQKFSVGTYSPSDASGGLINGYVSGVRLTNTAVASGVPTSPPTAVSGTAILLNFTNAGVIDATAKNVLETVGNAQISTTQSKWGGGSILFDGTADALRIPDDEKENLRFGTGNFTIEFWAWKSANGSMDYDTVISIGSTGSYNGGFSVELSASRGFCFISDNAIRVQSNFNPNDSTWNHYAVVRDGSTFALYKNGSRLTTATLSTTLGITGTAYVGAGALTDNSFNGYIDDLRVTKGLARYTGTTYTTPTAPFPVQ